MRQKKIERDELGFFPISLNINSSPDCGIQESGNPPQSKDKLREEERVNNFCMVYLFLSPVAVNGCTSLSLLNFPLLLLPDQE